MFRKLLVLVAAAAGAVAVQRKVRDQRAEQDLWSEATDAIRSQEPGRLDD